MLLDLIYTLRARHARQQDYALIAARAFGREGVTTMKADLDVELASFYGEEAAQMDVLNRYLTGR